MDITTVFGTVVGSSILSGSTIKATPSRGCFYFVLRARIELGMVRGIPPYMRRKSWKNQKVFYESPKRRCEFSPGAHLRSSLAFQYGNLRHAGTKQKNLLYYEKVFCYFFILLFLL
jgi:hypothetical protein